MLSRLADRVARRAVDLLRVRAAGVSTTVTIVSRAMTMRFVTGNARGKIRCETMRLSGAVCDRRAVRSRRDVANDVAVREGAAAIHIFVHDDHRHLLAHAAQREESVIGTIPTIVIAAARIAQERLRRMRLRIAHERKGIGSCARSRYAVVHGHDERGRCERDCGHRCPARGPAPDRRPATAAHREPLPRQCAVDLRRAAAKQRVHERGRFARGIRARATPSAPQSDVHARAARERSAARHRATPAARPQPDARALLLRCSARLPGAWMVTIEQATNVQAASSASIPNGAMWRRYTYWTSARIKIETVLRTR